MDYQLRSPLPLRLRRGRVGRVLRVLSPRWRWCLWFRTHLACPYLIGMLSYRRALQPLQAQPHAGYPGSHHPGNHPVLLPGNHRTANCPRSKFEYPNHHRDSHFHIDLHLYVNNHPDSYTELDSHPDINVHTHSYAHRQPYAYIHLDPDPLANFHSQRNADADIHTGTNCHIYADLHIHRNLSSSHFYSH